MDCGRFLDKSPFRPTLLGCVDEHPTTDDDGRFLCRLATGETTAFAQLYERFGTRLYRAAMALVGNREDAEDCVQEVFAALVRSRQRLTEVQDLPAYLFASLRRQAARSAERRAQQPKILASEPEPPADDSRGEAMRAALESLNAEQREVIALKVGGQLTFKEIGRALDISPNTAASRYRYALARLVDRMRK